MKVVLAGLELTIMGTLSVGCKVTCAQLTKLNGRNTIIRWRTIGSSPAYAILASANSFCQLDSTYWNPGCPLSPQQCPQIRTFTANYDSAGHFNPAARGGIKHPARNLEDRESAAVISSALEHQRAAPHPHRFYEDSPANTKDGMDIDFSNILSA